MLGDSEFMAGTVVTKLKSIVLVNRGVELASDNHSRAEHGDWMELEN